MKQLRRDVFETNSSSTHSLTMCSSNDYEAWKNGETYLVRYPMTSESAYADKEFVTLDQALDIIAKSKYYSDAEVLKEEFRADLSRKDLDIELREYDFITYDAYWDIANEYEDTFEQFYTTKSGDEIVAFGYYGYSG